MPRNLRRARFVVWLCTVLGCAAQARAATVEVDSPAADLPAARCVQGAIAAEIRADRVERNQLIGQALRVAPDFAPARWQAGQIRYADEWLTVDAAVEKGAQNDLLQKYRKLRSVYGNSAEGQLTLARWCQKHQLTAETIAHASQLLALRPNDPEVLKMLDLTWHKGQLITVVDLSQRKDRDEKARQAMQHWRPLLGAIRNKIDSKSTGERDAGLDELHAIDDPAAVEALIAVFKNRPSSLCEALAVIGQLPGQVATDALLQQAMLSKHEDVRLAACEQLKTRCVYGYVPKLMAALSTPLRASFEIDRDGDGIHFRKTIQREKEDATVAKTVDTEVGLLTLNPRLGNIIGQAYTDTLIDAQTAANAASKVNQKLIRYNESIYWVLDHTVGDEAAHDPQAWWNWWHQYNVMSTNKKPLYVDRYYNPVDVPFMPYEPTPISGISALAVRHVLNDGCFARGTKVWTATGPLAIENVQVGDSVFAQSPLSGELTFKPVLHVTVGHQAFVALEAEGEQLLSTAGHVFWVSGAGWRMAKELKIGDRLHTVSGWSEIQSIKPVDAGETHNLVVADFNSYFVGDARVLVHDITVPQIVTGGVPGELVAR